MSKALTLRHWLAPLGLGLLLALGLALFWPSAGWGCAAAIWPI